jgi:cation-transporting ATPase 13A3/4/5
VSSEDLVPGDLIEIPKETRMPCDCIMMAGGAVVNEAMLTGESIPVIKTGLPDKPSVYNAEEDKKYTIYSGTEVLQTKSSDPNIKAIAVVTRTGFSTLKGGLIRCILYPKVPKFSFHTDSYKYLAVMFAMSIIGVVIQLTSISESNTLQVVLKCFDLVTITVPPALPACLSIGINFAVMRLKRVNIYCISPQRINLAGKVTIFCFDKTGTLTEDTLSVDGYLPIDSVTSKGNSFQSFYDSVKFLAYEQDKESANELFVQCMASCHSLVIIKDKIIGDPLDKEMFIGTRWKLEETTGREDRIGTFISSLEDTKHRSISKLGIIKRFDFNSKLQRMSVIVKNMNTERMRLFIKGSPEKIAELSKPKTLPNNFNDILSLYTQKGCRVLGLSTKPLDLDLEGCYRADREEVEKDVDFLGFLVLKNSIKKATQPIISVLRNANIRTIMITGDNGFTAITVAKECGMIEAETKVYLGELQELREGKSLTWILIDDPKSRDNERTMKSSEANPSKTNLEKPTNNSSRLVRVACQRENNTTLFRLCEDDPWTEDENYALAFTGKAWDYLIEEDPKCLSEQIRKYLGKAVVFARMSPESKATLIEALQSTGMSVGMCGDGANDCVALKTADVGISLSDTEASVAAPFTSRVPDISCVVRLLREGRAALTTSFQCFKFMALYSMIQFITVTLLYSLDRNLIDYQFLIIDLAVLFPLAITMSYSKAASKLSKQLPVSNLLSFPIICSILGQVVIQAAVQVIVHTNP